ncbi:MAG: helix-turn-helix domain-containing protein [Bacteroidia bacterium]
MNAGFEFQEKFVAQLKTIVPANISLAEELADILQVSTDSVYRRLRCQSAFSFDEVASISKKFGVSVDGLLNMDSLQVTFNFNPMYEDKSNFGKYLKWFSQYLSELANTPGTQIIYAADDVPVFRHFNYSNLSAFKSFYWSKAILNSEVFVGKKFNPESVPQEIIDINKQTYISYSQINSIEIWTDETLTSTLNQVEFFWESDLFENRDQVMLVINDLREMMEELKTNCENSCKNHPTKPGEFMLYNSEVMIGNNCVSIKPGESKLSERIFLGHNTFNSISTYNAAFTKETRLWMENLTKKSLLLSGTAEKQRAKFFKKMDDQINALERNVMGGVSSF